MASSNICWGIEAGAGAIKAIKLELTESGPKLVDFAYIPHAKTLSTPGLDQDDAMRVALGTLASQFDLSGARIAVSVPGHSSFARFAKLPPVEPKKVPDIVKFEAVQQIPFPLEEVEWDYQTFQAPDSPDIEVGIFAITKEKINHLLQMLADVRISPDVVVVSPVAVYNALAFDLEFTEKTPGTIILDIGTTSTDLIIAEAGRVWIRTFPLGGHHFTDALVNQFKLGYPKAEKLKRDSEQGPHSKHVFQAMRGVFTDLVQDIQRSMGYYQSLHRDAKLTRLIGMGATFQLPGLRKFLKQQLSIDVYRMEEFKRLTVDEARKADFEPTIVSMSTAYGLALQGLGLQTIDANLIPVERVRNTMWDRKVPWFGVAAGVALAASVAMFYRPFTDKNKADALRPSAEIGRVVSTASTMKSEAEAAGVVGSAQPNYTAANMIAIGQNVPYFGYLTADLAKMLNDAESVKATGLAPGAVEKLGPAFMMKEFRTDFVPPQMSAASKRSAGGARQGGRGTSEQSGYISPGGRDSGGYDDYGSSSSSEPGIDKPRIAINLTLTTTHPDPRRLVNAAVLQWLRTNATRPGVPYQIVVDPTTMEVQYDIVQIVEEELAGAPTDLTDEELEDPQKVTEWVMRNNPNVQITGGPVRPQGSGSAALDSLAPITPPPGQAAPKRVSTMKVFWYVILGEPQAQSSNGGDQ